MDPISTIGLIGATTRLIVTCGKIAIGLHDLKEKYKDTNSTLRNISLECRTLRAAVMQIQGWIEDLGPQQKTSERIQPIFHAMVDFQASLDPLHEDLTSTLAKATPLGDLPSKVKFGVIWNETKMKDHLDSVRWQANAMHLLLSSTQLPRQESIQKIAKIARDVSSFRDGSLFHDSGSTINGTEFDFDDEVINSTAYRQALRSYQRGPRVRLPIDRGSASSTIREGSRGSSPKEEASEAETEDLIDFSRDYETTIQQTSLEATTKYSKDIEELMNLSILEVEPLANIPEPPPKQQECWVRKTGDNGQEIYENNLTKQTAIFVERASSSTRLCSIDTDIDDTFLPESECWVHLQLQNGRKFWVNTKKHIMPSFVSHEAHRKGEIVTDFHTVYAGLFKACKSEDESVLVNLLGSPNYPVPGIMARDQRCWTALHYLATLSSCVALKIETLLNAGAEIDARAKNEETPLLLAASGGNIDALKALLKAGADKTLQDVFGTTALDWAVRVGHAEMVRELLKDVPYEDHPQRNLGLPYIHFASRDGNLEVLKALFGGLTTGASMKNWIARINTRWTDGSTPLSLATVSNHLPVVKFLLSFGAENLGDMDGRTALHIASRSGFLDIVREFHRYKFDLSVKRHKDGYTSLHLAAYNGRAEVVKFLLECGQKEVAADNNYLPLHMACQYGHIKSAEALLNHGSDINLACKHTDGIIRLTPLGIAISRNRVRMVEVLLNRGASISDVGNGESALEYATRHHRAQSKVLGAIWSFMVSPNADIQPLPQEELGKLLDLICQWYTPFRYSNNIRLVGERSQNDVDKVQWLLAHGDPRNYRGARGNSTMHHISSSNLFAIAYSIPKGSLALEARNDTGNTPLHLAVYNGALEMVKFLLENNVSATPLDGKDQTPAAAGYRSTGWDDKPITQETRSKIENLLAAHTKFQRKTPERPARYSTLSNPSKGSLNTQQETSKSRKTSKR